MSSPKFPVLERDRRHLLSLRRDLWHERGSRASLMVGAGVSRNARPLPGGGGSSFPTWLELTEHMRKEIYPRDETSGQVGNAARCPRPGPERIASEYEAAFGRRALEDLIRQRVPDRDYEPGRLHEELLRLPWRDVFTTNYDTLLERTSVFGANYHPVVSAKELTHAILPRIIKLHGSLGSAVPLIATEEDYRTYPNRFAPLVNTVRQSLIESALVLVGFSGDDRNFLEWTGWIQDELGLHRRPIYLVVCEHLDDVQRRLLDQRGVTPIVLATSTNLRESGLTPSGWALLEFVRGLSKEKRRVEKWTIELSEETMETPPSAGAEDRNAEIKHTVRRWERERKAYPGWVIAPVAERQRLWHSTRYWVEPVLKTTGSWSVSDRIVALDELNWRLEVALVPLFPEWCQKIEEAAMNIGEPVRPAREESPAKESVKFGAHLEWSVQEAWIRLVLALVREARETHNESRWDTYMKMLDGVVDPHSRLVDRYRYESVLWRLTQIDRRQARELLAAWKPAPGALRASLWRAGLLAEAGQPEEARETLKAALGETRRATRRSDARSVELLSIEGWCAYLLFAVEWSLDFGRGEALREDLVGRWRDLRAMECDPWGVHEYFSRVLEREPPKPARNVQSWPAFDPGRTHVVHHWGRGGIDPWLPGFAYLRWLEEVGIPARRGGLLAVPKELVAACRWVVPFFSLRSVAVLVRAGATKELQGTEFVTRPQVAERDLEGVKQLNAIMLEAVERETTVLARETKPWTDASILEAAVEVLSRLTVRLEHSDLDRSFRAALALYADWRSVSIHRLGSVVNSWFERLCEAADDTVLGHWFPALLEAPLPERDAEGASGQWRDPVAIFPLYRLLGEGAPADETRDAIRRAATRLLARGEVETSDGRGEVVSRLSTLLATGLLSDRQREQLAALLWRGVGDGLPRWEGFWVADYATLPTAGRDDVLQRVKNELMRRLPVREARQGRVQEMVLRKDDHVLWEVAAATTAVVAMPYEPDGVVEWTADEFKTLWKGLCSWWWERRREMKMEKSGFSSGAGDRTRDRAAEIERCLVRLKVAALDPSNDAEWAEVTAFMTEAEENGVELGGALPYLLIHRPRLGKRTAEQLMDDLCCGDARRAMAAARAVRHWIYLAETGSVRKVPSAVIAALVDRVAFRLLEGATDCIRTLAAILVEKGDVFSTASIQRLVSSLNAWERAVEQVTEDSESPSIPQDERPDLRAGVGVLVNGLNVWWAKNRAGRRPPELIRRLKAKYQEDPLPEVRRAVSDGRWRYW